MIKKKKAEDYTSPALDELMDETDEKVYKRTEKRMMLATRIDEAKRAKGWKNKDLAEALEKKPSEISKYLSGTHNFTIDTLSDLEEVLGIQLINFREESKAIVIQQNTVTVSSEAGTRESIMEELQTESGFFLLNMGAHNC
ncbi:MAG: helix-turn-helix transcriptional regulator [Bacteroidales bacterium]|nr:helix-turn-helix transcriptional regulator [Bacteroidales bacterium]